MTAQILTLHPRQGETRRRPSVTRSARAMTHLGRIIRRIVEAVGWFMVIGLTLGHMP